MARTYKELKSLKLAGTALDRRRKISNEDRERIVDLYWNRKARNLTIDTIAKIFDIHLIMVSRYANYDKYLERQRLDSFKHFSRMTPDKKSELSRNNHVSMVEYKTAILDTVDKFKKLG